ncbi:hypothetical protein AHP1_2501 [Aeromonas phage Ahp1_CNU-2021]|nr:hypothetical protein AHP1_2501 [Aeromonas phage Ahp1_CNU-2021]
MFAAKDAAALMAEAVERKKTPEANRMLVAVQRAANDGGDCATYQTDVEFPIIRAAMEILIGLGYTATADRRPESTVYDVKIAWRHI